MKEYKFCQSCGYPMKKDPQGGGTEEDGSINKKYCYMCYKDGKFLTPKEIDTAKKKGIHPSQIVIATDGLSVIIHPDNPVSKLTPLTSTLTVR